MKRLLLSAVVFVMVALLAVSAVPAGEDGRWYIGFGAGSTDDKILSESDTGIKLFGGYEFNQYVAVEGAFVDLGDFVFGFFDQSGTALEVVGYWPVGEEFKLFAKAGIFAWDLEVVGFTADDGTDPTFGVGGQWAFAEHWAARAEYERFMDIGDGDVDFLSVSVLYRF